MGNISGGLWGQRDKSKGINSGSGWSDRSGNTWDHGWSNDITTRNPWDKQSPYLQDIFKGASDLYKQGTPKGVTDTYGQGFDQMGKQIDQTLGMQGDMQGKWNSLQNQQQQATNKYNNLTDKVLGTTMGDIQGQAADFAGKNPYLQNAIDQSWANANKMLGQQVGGPGGINHQASSGGNMSSSRAGVAEGVAGAEMANMGQQNELALRQQAYDQGLGQANQMMGNQMGMAGMLKTGAADMAGLLNGQQNSQSGFQDMIRGLFQDKLGFAKGPQQDQWNNLNNFMGIIGARDWGGTTHSQGEDINQHAYRDIGNYQDKSKNRNSGHSWGGNINAKFGL